jgi:hypothetical protein
MNAPAPSPAPDVRAEEIFSRTRAAFVARQYPPTIKYKVRVSGLRDGTWTGRSYSSYERWPSTTVIARDISDEEIADPAHPHGFALKIAGVTTGETVNPDILGIPKLAPTYSFGLGATPKPEASPGSPASLRTIGTVLAASRNYDVRLLGEESVDGTLAWHLRLRPIGNRGKYRLRDLWVEESDYQTIRLRTDGNFTGEATGAGLWTVEYSQIGGSWYLVSEVSNGPVDTADGTYEHVALQFTDIEADPSEHLDFGFGDTPDEAEIVEPAP